MSFTVTQMLTVHCRSIGMLSWLGYCVVCSNEDFGVLRVLGVLGDSGFSGEQRLHKSMWLGIKQGLIMWPQITIGEVNSDWVDYAKEGSFGGFGKPHVFLVKVYQRPVFTKRTSLRLVLWNRDSIYTSKLETTGMFKEVLVDVYGIRQKATEADRKWEKRRRKQEGLSNIKLLYQEVMWSKGEWRQSVTGMIATVYI